MTATIQDLEEVRQVLVDWVRDQTGVSRVRWGQTNSPKLALPFVNLQFGGVRKLGSTDYTGMATNLDTQKQVKQAESTLVVDLHYPTRPDDPDYLDGLNTMDNLLMSYQNPEVLTALRSSGVAIRRHGDIQNLAALVDAQWEGRAHAEVVVAFQREKVRSVSTIERASGTVDLTGPGLSEQVEFDQEI